MSDPLREGSEPDGSAQNGSPKADVAYRPRHSPYLDWRSRKSEILKEFTVTGKISVSANIAGEGAPAPGEEADGEEQSQPLAKARQRLQQLDNAAKGVATVEMSQAEYVRRIEKLHKDLQKAWENQRRVDTLRICIRSSKFLLETRVPQFYPSMFVLVTDILDTFGRLVFERLKSVADAEHKKMGGTADLPDDFISTDIGAETRETCRNWVYKTACIRELLPRLYVEMALLECYRFIYDADFAAILLRLSHSMRGIGNPLIAVYARLYLARMAAKMVRDDNRQRDSVFSGISDYLFAFNEIASGAREHQLETMGITMPVYLNLHSPAVGWQMHQLAWCATKEVFQHILASYKDTCGSSMVLKHIIEAFDPAFYAPHVNGMISLIKDSKPSLVTQADLYRSLARQLAICAPPMEHRIAFLNEAWKAITKVGDPVAYAKNAAALVELLVAAYSEREILILLGDLCKRLQHSAIAAGQEAVAAGRGGGKPGKGHYTAPPAALPYLERIMTTLIEAEVSRATAGGKGASFSGVVTSEHFTTLLDMFASEHKPNLCKSLLTALTSVKGIITDPVVINTMFEVARTCHDALDVLTSEDEIRMVSALISAFIEKIDLGRDLERQLEVYADCRQSFPNLDLVKLKLVFSAINLIDKAYKFMKGRHTPKTAAFVKSCLAFIAITVPAIDDPFARMLLYQQSGLVALQNQCIVQGDMLLRSVVQEIPDLPQSMSIAVALSGSSTGSGLPSLSSASDARLYDFLKDYTLAIIPSPGHPEQGAFYLARGILNAIQRYPWQAPTLSPYRFRSTLTLIPLMVAYSEDPLPAKIPGVDGNDVLYAGDEAYKDELRGFLRSVIENLLAQLQELSQAAEDDSRVKGMLVELTTELLAYVGPCLDIDKGLVPLIEQVCLLLKQAVPDHAALKITITTVQGKLKQQ